MTKILVPVNLEEVSLVVGQSTSVILEKICFGEIIFGKEKFEQAGCVQN